ncbi:MAG: MATE family efflux transporter [Oscillospiraceae bacterium]
MENIKENKMGIMPIPKLLMSVSAPLMFSMIIQAMYNIVDSIFVAKISEDALTAVSLVFPVQSLIIAVGVGTGVGINSLLSRRLGEKRFKEANSVAVNGLLVSFLSGIVFAVFGLIFARPFISSFTQSEAIIKMGVEYLSVITIFSFASLLQFACERIIQSTGNTMYNLAIQGVGAVINIILDPIFIFVLDMGVLGAAIATVIGQFVAMCIGFYINHIKNKEVDISFKGFKPNGKTIGEIYKVGFPAIIMQSIMSVMTVGMNKILLPYSASAASVVGVYFKLNSFVFMPLFGLTNGMVPIVAYNYGAQHKKRVMGTFKLSMIFSLVIMALGTLLFQLAPALLMGMFTPSAEMLRIGIPALRIISTCFVLSGICIVFSTFFQALGNGVYSLIISVTRQLLVILPAAYILGKIGGINAAWWAFALSEVVALVLCFIMYGRLKKKVLDKMIDKA